MRWVLIVGVLGFSRVASGTSLGAFLVPHSSFRHTQHHRASADPREETGDSTDFLESCLEVTESEDDELRREMREMGMTNEQIDYTMSERRRRGTPPVGTPAYKGLSTWWSNFFGVDVD